MNRAGPALSLALLACVCMLRPAAGACAPEVEPNDAMAEAQAVVDAFCLAGSTEGGDQDSVLWQLDSAAEATLTLEGLPGQDARLQLFQLFFTDDGVAVEATRLVNLTGAPDVATPAATLLPGRYGLLLSSDTGSLIYRVTATLSPAAPSAEPPGPQAGAFSLAAPGAETIVFPWTLDETAAAERWTLALTVPLGAPTTLMLQDGGGATLATASAADFAGTMRLADLGLAAGDYTIAIFAAPEGVPVTVAATPEGAREPAVEEEPDDVADRAFPADVGVAVAGRLVGSVAEEDVDCLAVEVGEAAAGHRFDAVVRVPGDQELELSLLSADGVPVQARSARGDVRMSGVVLAPGRHVFCLTGALPADQRYAFTLEDRGAGAAGSELEPNDSAATANELSAEGAAFAELTGEDIDSFRLQVTGEPQQWLIQAAGEGVARVTLLDGAGVPVADARGEPGDRLVRLPDTPLLAGDYVIEVAGADGRYLLRATPLGPAGRTTDPNAVAELEPNGSVDAAMALGWDRPVEGTLADGADSDVYRLSLAGETHVALTLTVPGSIGVQGSLTWGEAGYEVGRLDATAGAAGETVLVWDGLLPAGEHYLALSSLDAAASPYRLLAERRSRFDLPADLEPNNQWWQAAPLPANHRLSGTLGPQEADWYRLPPLDAPGDIVIRPESPEDPLLFGYLHVVEAVPTGSWPQLDSATVATLTFDGEALRAPLPAGKDLFLLLSGAAGAYSAAIELGGLAPTALAAPPPALDVSLEFSATEVAAFSEFAQSVEGTLRLRNPGPDSLDFSFGEYVSDASWKLALAQPTLTLAPGEEAGVPVVLTAAPLTPDDGPVAVEIQVRDQVVAAAPVEPVQGAAPVAPRRAWPLPEALLGGINVAWAALGGVSVDDHPALNDGFVTANGTASFANYELATLQPTIDLAGEEPVELIGVVLHPGSQAVQDRLRDFTLLVSDDGASFAPVLTARLSPLPVAQGFLFAAPTPARFLRLAPLSGQGNGSYVTVAELAAIAAPGALPADQLLDGRLDIARPDLGGHVVWRSAPGDDPDAPPAPAEWVVGFAGGRAAQVAGIQWQDDPAAPAEERLASLEISASLGSAAGPWESVGTTASPGELFPAPVWARYLRFSARPGPGQTALTLPPHVAVLEAPPADGYRSIVGAWSGEDARAAWELLNEETPPAAPADTAATGPGQLRLDEPVSGTVRRPVDRNRYALEIPEGLERIDLIVGEPAGERLGLALFDPAGEPVELERQEATADRTRYTAAVAPGAYAVEMFQAPASIAVLWDTSGSVQQMQPVMHAALTNLVGRVDLDDAVLSLFPFRGEVAPLLSDFTADRRLLNQAMAAYDWSDSSSDAELVLLTAANLLFDGSGARAIVMFTDGENDVSPVNLELWRRLGEVRPAIVSALMPSIVSGEDRWRPAGLVRDWALVGGGFDTVVDTSLPAYERAWRRLAAALDRPAAYTLTATVASTPRTDPGATGFLSVEAGETAPSPPSAQGAVEVLLDVSGSMLQRLDEGRRIEIAQATLTRLVGEMLAPGTPFALRIFGQGAAGSCDSSLAVPVGPLDPAAASAAIAALQPVDGARTPIATALRLVAEDMAATEPPRLVVLVTDGEETCDGDPAAEIEQLQAAGFETRINILGFAVEDPALADTFRDWAASAGGVYLEAADSASFDAAMADAVQAGYPVSDASGTAVGTVVAGAPLELPAGNYSVDFGNGSEPVAAQVTAGATTVVTAP